MLTIEQEAAKSLDEVVTTLGAYAFTRRELEEAFKLVEPKDNWKGAIKATVQFAGNTFGDGQRQRLATHVAVRFYTGSVARMTHEADGSYTVQAAGYYATIDA